jgi:thiamine-monophosphate kinase
MARVKVSDIGEFGLIRRLAEKLSVQASGDLIIGIGDDAAVWRVGGRAVIATTDTLVQGVHFLAGVTPWRDLGWKALAVNVSDVAAMGGSPAFALVTLAVPPDAVVESFDELYVGLRECAEAYGVTIAGGDVVRAPVFSVTVALMGEAVMEGREPLLLRRDAAKTGDAIAVTGVLGDSAAGLRRLTEGGSAVDALVQKHLRPQPRLESGRAAIEAGIRCGIDVSDGLLQDVGHICEASGVSAVLRAQDVPVSDALRAAYPDEALMLACTGGEDYELVLVGTRERLEGLDVSVIGEIVPEAETLAQLLDKSGEPLTFPEAGWDHLRGGKSENGNRKSGKA